MTKCDKTFVFLRDKKQTAMNRIIIFCLYCDYAAMPDIDYMTINMQ